MRITKHLKSAVIVSFLSVAGALLPSSSLGDTTNIAAVTVNQQSLALNVCGSGCVQNAVAYNVSIVFVSQGSDFAPADRFADLSPRAPFDFGNVVSAKAKSFTLTNTSPTAPPLLARIGISGLNWGDFREADNCPRLPGIDLVVLAPGASCSITVTFVPTQVGARRAVLAVRSSAIDSPYTVDLSGTGVAATMTPSSLDFGSVSIGNSLAAAATIHNPGSDPLPVTGVGVTGINAADFSAGGCASVAAGASCTIGVTFAPKDAGPRSAGLNVTVNGLGGPFAVALAGVGAPLSLSPSQLDFGSQRVGTVAGPQNLVLKNAGASPLTLETIGFTGAAGGDFKDAPDCGTLPATLPGGGSCSLPVTFDPSATGARSAGVAIQYSAGGAEFSAAAALNGTGTMPGFAFNPTVLGFGSVTVGSARSQQVTLSNPGSAPTTISAISLSGGSARDYTLSGSCESLPITLAPNGSCQLSVTLSPRATGNEGSTLSVVDTAPGSPHALPITASGVTDPPPSATSTGTTGTNAAATSTASGAVIAAAGPALPNTGARGSSEAPCLVGFVAPVVGRVELAWLIALALLVLLGVGIRIRSHTRL